MMWKLKQTFISEENEAEFIFYESVKYEARQEQNSFQCTMKREILQGGYSLLKILIILFVMTEYVE